MPKTTKAAVPLGKKTAFLRTLIPPEYEIRERWKTGQNGPYFDGWDILKKQSGLAWLFADPRVAHLAKEMSPLSISDQTVVDNIVPALKSGIQKEFKVQMRTFGQGVKLLSRLI